MSETISASKRGRGRPPTTGRGVQVTARMHDPLLSDLDRWISFVGEDIDRGEAIRRLVRHTLTSMKLPRGGCGAVGDKATR